MPNPKAGFVGSIRDDGIITCHFNDSLRKTVDTWIEVTRQQFDELDTQPTLRRYLYTFDHRMIPTPYAVQMTIQVAREVPSEVHDFRVACVITNQRLYSMLRYILSVIDARKDFIRFFNDEPSALEWLHSSEPFPE